MPTLLQRRILKQKAVVDQGVTILNTINKKDQRINKWAISQSYIDDIWSVKFSLVYFHKRGQILVVVKRAIIAANTSNNASCNKFHRQQLTWLRIDAHGGHSAPDVSRVRVLYRAENSFPNKDLHICCCGEGLSINLEEVSSAHRPMPRKHLIKADLGLNHHGWAISYGWIVEVANYLKDPSETRMPYRRHAGCLSAGYLQLWVVTVIGG